MNSKNKIRDISLAISLLGIVGLTVGLIVVSNQKTESSEDKLSTSSNKFMDLFTKEVLNSEEVLSKINDVKLISKTVAEEETNNKIDLLQKEIIKVAEKKLTTLLDSNVIENKEEFKEALDLIKEKFTLDKVKTIIGYEKTGDDAATGIFKDESDFVKKYTKLLEDWLKGFTDAQKLIWLAKDSDKKLFADNLNKLKTSFQNFVNNTKFAYYDLDISKDIKKGDEGLKLDGTKSSKSETETDFKSRQALFDILKFFRSEDIKNEDTKYINAIIQDDLFNIDLIKKLYDVKTTDAKGDGSDFTLKTDLSGNDKWDKLFEKVVKNVYFENKELLFVKTVAAGKLADANTDEGKTYSISFKKEELKNVEFTTLIGSFNQGIDALTGTTVADKKAELIKKVWAKAQLATSFTTNTNHAKYKKLLGYLTSKIVLNTLPTGAISANEIKEIWGFLIDEELQEIKLPTLSKPSVTEIDTARTGAAAPIADADVTTTGIDFYHFGLAKFAIRTLTGAGLKTGELVANPSQAKVKGAVLEKLFAQSAAARDLKVKMILANAVKNHDDFTVEAQGIDIHKVVINENIKNSLISEVDKLIQNKDIKDGFKDSINIKLIQEKLMEEFKKIDLVSKLQTADLKGETGELVEELKKVK